MEIRGPIAGLYPLPQLYHFFTFTQKEQHERKGKQVPGISSRRSPRLLPGSLVLKNDPNYIQGIPDLMILHGDMWVYSGQRPRAMEFSEPGYYVNQLTRLGFARFIYPRTSRRVFNDAFSSTLVQIMRFVNHRDLEGKHAFLGPVSLLWLPSATSDDKVVKTYRNARAAAGGTLHEIAAEHIRLGLPFRETTDTVGMFVNDAIGMT